MPGRSERVRGLVVHGDKRGRQIGFPTANVRLDNTQSVLFGVYAGTLDGMPAAISVGVRPTFGEHLVPMLEAHVLDFHGDLYGREVTVILLKRLRDEIRFDSVNELITQIERDVQAVRDLRI